MIVLSWLYVTYGSLPQVNNFLYVLKPAVLGIIAAGIIKLGRAAIRDDEERHGFVTAGRQTPYKRIDLAVEAATQLDVPLIVIGKGPDHRWLKKIAGRSVTFLTRVSDEDMPKRFGEAKAFFFPWSRRFWYRGG